MRICLRLISLAVTFVLASLALCPVTYGLDKETERAIRDAKMSEPSPIDAVNDFVSHSAAIGAPRQEIVTVQSGRIYVRLLTPLNSSFNMSGDTVKAVVIGSQTDRDGKPWLQEGTILEGCVEGAKKATYGQTDGSLAVRFYVAKFDNQRIELFSTPDTDDHNLKPSPVHLSTKKERIRGILMTATRIAVPAAIGSGGMSLAITAGAGAAIGLAFSEKGKRIQGTVRGAWEGAGLTVFDPIVRKGNSVILPQGTALQLQITEPLRVPKYVAALNQYQVDAQINQTQSSSATAASLTQLTTHAEIVKNSSTSSSPQPAEGNVDVLTAVNTKIAQNDLAAALSALNEAETMHPDDQNVKNMHKKLFDLISGKSPDTETSTNH
jgi:hypothetical protein